MCEPITRGRIAIPKYKATAPKLRGHTLRKVYEPQNNVIQHSEAVIIMVIIFIGCNSDKEMQNLVKNGLLSSPDNFTVAAKHGWPIAYQQQEVLPLD